MDLSIGQIVDLEINDIAFGGEGVGRREDFVVFVPFVAIGEVVEVEIRERKKNFARARLIRVIRPNAGRLEPSCPHYTQCGGCQYQHIAYSDQLTIKHKQIGDLFERVGDFSAALIEPVVPCPVQFGYRNRIMVRTQYNRDTKGMNVGFLRHDSRLVVDVKSCPIAEPALNLELEKVRVNPPRKNGVKFTLRTFPEGWELPPDSFFQVNDHLWPKMVELVADCLRDAGSQYLIDAYCGVGFFSVELASAVKAFVGVEIDKQAIKSAQINAQNRNCTNGRFIEASTEAVLPELLEDWPAEKSTVVLDPPRRGCHAEALTCLRQVNPKQIIYVSCHPATLARDLKTLCGDGVYELAKVIPLDMFPQTQHVECIADLRACLKNRNYIAKSIGINWDEK